MQKVNVDPSDVRGRAEGQGGFSGSIIDTLLRQDSVSGAVAYVLNAATERNRGKLVTELLIAANLAGPELREVYQQNKDALDQYFLKIDMQRLVELIGPELTSVGESEATGSREGVTQRDVISFLSGAGAGVGVRELLQNILSDE